MMHAYTSPSFRSLMARLYLRFGKRLLDTTAAALGLIVISPLLVAIAALVRIFIGSPVLFRQQRPGLRARPFMLLKFRTMRAATDDRGEDLPDEERLTSLGAVLRRYSLDELPELLNVLRGDMSVVGPRPLLMQYVERYTPEQRRRHDVLPGITGWAQVNGRNALSWEEKFALDTWYVDHAALLLDLRILLMTAVQVFQPKGIAHAGHATMPEFRGAGSGSGPREDD